VQLTLIPVGLWPRDLITTPSSATDIIPSSSLSKSMNASLNSKRNKETLLGKIQTIKKY